MSRFFFHLREGARLTRDEEGRDLPDLATARAVALMSARDIICGEVMLGQVQMGDSIEIADDADRTLMRVRFSEAVSFEE